MLDFSFAEIALVVVVTVVFIRPEDMPAVIRTVSKALRGVRSLAKELRDVFNDFADESGLQKTADEIHKEIRMIKGDDGKMYESYDVPLPPKPPEMPHDG